MLSILAVGVDSAGVGDCGSFVGGVVGVGVGVGVGGVVEEPGKFRRKCLGNFVGSTSVGDLH